LRNPLGTIRNALYLLKYSPLSKDPECQEHIGVAKEEIERSNTIISNLMKVAQGIPPTKEETALFPLVEEAFKKTNPPDGIYWHGFFEPEPFAVWADTSQLQQVFCNLFLNAIQAMGKSGDLVVKARHTLEGDEITVQDNACIPG
jgi:signal transduction histidine kinase